MKFQRFVLKNLNTNYYNKLLQKLKVIYDDFILKQNNAISDINIIIVRVGYQIIEYSTAN